MNDFPDSVMLFAAGFGTRMGALTRDTPKPLIPVAGVAMIDRALKLARAVAPVRIVANLHYRADQLADHLTPQGVVLSHEPDILETGGGLRKALPLLGNGPVYTVNPDVIWRGPNPLSLLREAWIPAKMDALLMCIPPENALGYTGVHTAVHTGGNMGAGDFTADADGRIRRGSGLIYGGVQIVKTDGLRDIAQAAFSLNVLWDRMMADDRLYCVTYSGQWCDVGHPAGIALAEEMLADNV
jgi:N-acetyl-alpha-D-muramate 1-phosphate uridylyltransferase